MRNRYNKKNTDLLESIAKFFLGFLVPYVAINGLILFLFVSYPTINVDSENGLSFTISSALPIISTTVTLDDEKVPFTVSGNKYIVDAKRNGMYKITTTSLNRMTITTYEPVDSFDDTPPSVNLETATFSAGTLSFSIDDNDSGINYDNVYIKNPDDSIIHPSYIDKSTGTVQFKITSTEGIIIHIEDLNGNSSDTTF